MANFADKPLPAHCAALPCWQRDWLLFWTYVKITSLVVGGGYAIIAAAQQEFVERRKWLDDDDVMEMVTITQTVPGILAVNSSVYVGWKIDRWRGAACAIIGATLPSLVILTLIAAGAVFLKDILETPTARGAFRGVIGCITGMVIVTALRLRKKALTKVFDILIASGCFIGMSVLRFPPAWLIVSAILGGLLYTAWNEHGREEEKK